MQESFRPVESGNALDLRTYCLKFLPDVYPNLLFESPSLDVKYAVSLGKPSTMKPADLDQCFSLLKSTTEADYTSASMGWHPKRKIKEMKLPDLRYLLVRRVSGNAIEAFASFMLTYEDGKEVIYLYEIHLEGHLRGNGLGRKLMSLVEEAGRKARVEKAMLTVFRANRKARQFYGALGYVVDEYSPEPRVLRNGTVKESDYEILSKVL